MCWQRKLPAHLGDLQELIFPVNNVVYYKIGYVCRKKTGIFGNVPHVVIGIEDKISLLGNFAKILKACQC